MAQVIRFPTSRPPGGTPAPSFSEDGPTYRQRVMNVLARYSDPMPVTAIEEQLLLWGERYESCPVGIALMILRGRGAAP